MRFADKHGFYELNPFPGCNQIVVSNHAFIYPEFRGKGYGVRQHVDRLRKAQELGYDMIICTVRDDNAPELHILKKFEWTFLTSFISTETGHLVQMWSKSFK